MKAIIIFTGLIVFISFGGTKSFGFETDFASPKEETARFDTIHIVTSAQCGMCTERIEKTLTFERGVKMAKLDLETGIVEVVYRGKQTNPVALRKAISKVGHDADDVEADAVAYGKLPGCCKKPDDPGHFKHD